MEDLVKRIKEGAGRTTGAQLYLHAKERLDLTNTVNSPRPDTYLRAAIGVARPDRLKNHWRDRITTMQQSKHKGFFSALAEQGMQPFEVIAFGKLDEPLADYLEHGTNESAHYVDYSFKTGLRDNSGRPAGAVHFTVVGTDALIKGIVDGLKLEEYATLTRAIFDPAVYKKAGKIIEARTPASRIAVLDTERIPLANNDFGAVKPAYYEKHGMFRELK